MTEDMRVLYNELVAALATRVEGWSFVEDRAFDAWPVPEHQLIVHSFTRDDSGPIAILTFESETDGTRTTVRMRLDELARLYREYEGRDAPTTDRAVWYGMLMLTEVLLSPILPWAPLFAVDN